MTKVLKWERLLAGQRPRAGHTATLVGGSKILVFGGRCGEQFMNDLWEFDLQREKWRQLQEHAPFPARAYHSATLVGKNKLWIVGGSDAKTIHDGVHILNTDTLEWSTPVLKSQGTPRGTHAAVLHPLDPKTILVFGGYGGFKPGSFDWLGDLSVLNTETLQWEVLQPGGECPCSRGYHSFTTYGHNVLVFGGKNTGGIVHENDSSVYDAVENKWFRIKPSGEGPGFRSNHVAVLANESNIIVHGGRYGKSRLSDCYSLEISAGRFYRWQKYDSKVVDSKSRTSKMVDAVDGPEGRAAHCLVVCNNALYMFGGYGGKGSTYSDMYVVRRLPQKGRQTKSNATSRKVSFVSLPLEGGEDNEGWFSTRKEALSASHAAANIDLSPEADDPYHWTPEDTAEKTVLLGEASMKQCSGVKRKSSPSSLEKEVQEMRRKRIVLEREVAAAQAGMTKATVELETLRAEKEHWQRTVNDLKAQVDTESTRASSLQKELDERVITSQRTDVLSAQLKEELQATASRLDAKERESLELFCRLSSVEKELDEQGSLLEQTKDLHDDAVLERDEYKSCVQKLEVELEKQMQALQQMKSNYDMERNYLLQEVAERKGTADRILTELGVSKESCRAMQEHVNLLTRQLDQANEKLDQHYREREKLSRANGALSAELQQVQIARDGAESSNLLLRKELESTRTLMERNALDATRMKENADEAAKHIAALHSSLKKAQEELMIKIAENDRLRNHLLELEKFELSQVQHLQSHIEKLKCIRQSCPSVCSEDFRC